MRKKNDLFIIRGVSGSGKSTFAKKIAGVHIEADMYWYDKDGNYNFDIKELNKAHQWCKEAVRQAMVQKFSSIAVSNTNTTDKEMQVYFDLARRYNYEVTVVVVENHHGHKDIHNVPESVLEKQENNLKQSIKLR